MSVSERERAGILRQVAARLITRETAAERLGLSGRQVKRLYRFSAILKVQNFRDFQIGRNVLQGWDAGFSLPRIRLEVGMRFVSRHAQGAWRQYRHRGLRDFGLSAFSMFFMQSGSFLAYQRALETGRGRSNCQTLFEIGRIPSDNYIRDRLDEADPALLRPCFERLEALLSEPPMRQAFGRLGGRTLVAWDGTEYFCSQKLGCPNCSTRKRSNGKVESYHSLLSATVVAPGHAKVVPLGCSLGARVRRAPGRRRETGLRT